jgi:hypothetical protein
MSAKQVMKIIFFSLVVQIILPAFMPYAQRTDNDHAESPACIEIQHHSVPFSLAMREKEEDEHEEDVPAPASIRLIIDFNYHTSGLNEWHASLCKPLHFDTHYDHQPPLFNLFCRLII